MEEDFSKVIFSLKLIVEYLQTNNSYKDNKMLLKR